MATPKKRKRRLTKTRALAAIEKSRGIVTLAAQIADVRRETMHRYIAKHPDVKAALRAARDATIDVVEAGLYTVAMGRGDQERGPVSHRDQISAAKYLLDRLARKRGYGKHILHEFGDLSEWDDDDLDALIYGDFDE